MDPQTADWHRNAAARYNNLAWDMVEAPQISDPEALLNAAHAAAAHWSEVGTARNIAHARALLCAAHARAGAPALARALFGKVSAHFEATETLLWEQALVATVAAHIAAAEGAASYSAAHTGAERAMGAIRGTPDYDIIEPLFVLLPRP